MAEIEDTNEYSISISLLGIDLVDFRANNRIKTHDNIPDKLSYSLEIESTINTKENTITMIVVYTLEGESQEMMYIKCKNTFLCKDVTQYFDVLKKTFTNERLERDLIKKSCSHTRGIQAYKIKDSPLKQYLIPLAIPKSLLRKKAASK